VELLTPEASFLKAKLAPTEKNLRLQVNFAEPKLHCWRLGLKLAPTQVLKNCPQGLVFRNFFPKENGFSVEFV
jgi:hypothetical protein